MKIIQGDCLLELKKISDNFVDLTVTSPPYDDMRLYNGYSFDFESVAKELFRVTKEGGVVVWVVGDATKEGNETGTSFRQALYFKEIGFNLHDTMIYEKAGTGACGSKYAYWQTWEYMFVLTHGKLKTFNPITIPGSKTVSGGSRFRHKHNGTDLSETRVTGREQRKSNIWRYAVGAASGDDAVKHPAKFPEALANDHILSWSNPGDLVLDPFVGSGTTGKMAILNGRDFIGIDISPEYCELARKRIDGEKNVGLFSEIGQL